MLATLAYCMGFMAGATLVQVGTASFSEPTAMLRIQNEVRTLCTDLGIARAADLIGTFRA